MLSGIDIRDCQLNWRYPDGWLAFTSQYERLCAQTPVKHKTGRYIHRHISMTCIQKACVIIKCALLVSFLTFLMSVFVKHKHSLLKQLFGAFDRFPSTRTQKDAEAHKTHTQKTFWLYTTICSIYSWQKLLLTELYSVSKLIRWGIPLRAQKELTEDSVILILTAKMISIIYKVRTKRIKDEVWPHLHMVFRVKDQREKGNKCLYRNENAIKHLKDIKIKRNEDLIIWDI